MWESISGHVLKKLIDQFWPGSKKPEPAEEAAGIYEQVHRFKRVLIAHDIKPTYWPEFFEIAKAPFSIRHADLKSDDTLLDWLDNTKVSWLCQTFLIDRDWMNGAGHGPHQHFSFGVHPQEMVESLKSPRKSDPLPSRHATRGLRPPRIRIRRGQSGRVLATDSQIHGRARLAIGH